MKAEQIFQIINAEVAPLLLENGFKVYKDRSYLRVAGGIIQVIKIACLKYDLHTWFACYPITEKNVWFGAATNSTSGRYPVNEKEIAISDLKSLQSILPNIITSISMALKYFNQRNSFQLLSDSIPTNDLLIPGLVKGYCLVSLGFNTEAVQYFNNIVSSDLSDTWKNSAAEILEAIQNGNSQEALESNKVQNIKKLRLKKYV